MPELTPDSFMESRKSELTPDSFMAAKSKPALVPDSLTPGKGLPGIAGTAIDLEEVATPTSIGEDIVSGVRRGFLGTIKSIGDVASRMSGADDRLIALERERLQAQKPLSVTPSEVTIPQARSSVRQQSQKVLEQVAPVRDTGSAKFGEALGSAGGFMAAAPLGIPGMLGVGGALGADEALTNLEESGVELTPAQKAAVTAGGVALGLTDAIPFERLFSRVAKFGGKLAEHATEDSLKKALFPTILDYLKGVGAQTLEEGAQEALQSVGQDVLQVGYGGKEAKDIGSTALQEFAAGGGVGALMAAVGLAAGSRIGRARLREAGLDPEVVIRAINEERREVEAKAAPMPGEKRVKRERTPTPTVGVDLTPETFMAAKAEVTPTEVVESPAPSDEKEVIQPQKEAVPEEAGDAGGGIFPTKLADGTKLKYEEYTSGLGNKRIAVRDSETGERLFSGDADSVREEISRRDTEHREEVERNSKKPWELTQNEYIKQQKTGHIQSDAYDSYQTSEGMHFVEENNYPEVIASKNVKGKNVEIRRNREPLKYVKHDANGDIARDEKGLALYLTNEEAAAEGYPTESADLGAFVDGKPVGFASNEFGTTGVWVVKDMQGGGLGTDLLREFHKINPRLASKPIGQMTNAGENMTRAYHRSLVKDAIERGDKVPQSVRDEYPELTAKEESKPVVDRLSEPSTQEEKQEVERPKLDATVAEIPVDEIHVDPARFQFKMDATGKAGVTDEFKEVQKFDPEKSGIISVWRDPADGRTYVVNGHHRVDLARRLNAPSLTVRYLDAKDAQEARLKGALINIAEGKGTAVDAAKVLRDGGYDEKFLEREGVSLKGEKAQQGLALSKLNPFIFDKVVSGEIPIERAAIIGRGVADQGEQVSLLKELDRREKSGRRMTNGQVEELIRLADKGPTKTETSMSLFGEEEFTRSLLPEKAEVSEYVRRRLGQEKRLFATVATDSAAKQLGSAGNVIKAGENANIAEQAQQAGAIYDKLSTSAGSINDALDAAAREIADGTNANVAKERAYDAIRGELVSQAQALSGRSGRPAGHGAEGSDKVGSGERSSSGQAEVDDSQEPMRFAKEREPSLFDQPDESATAQQYQDKLLGERLTAQLKSGLAKGPSKLKPAQNKSLFEDEGPDQPTLFAREAPGFFSQLERTIDSKFPARVSVQQAQAILKNPQNGVKPDELKWSGVEQWLGEQKGQIAKQDVLDFVRSNNVRVEEVSKGGDRRSLLERIDRESRAAKKAAEAAKKGIDSALEAAGLRIGPETAIDVLRGNDQHVRNPEKIREAVPAELLGQFEEAERAIADLTKERERVNAEYSEPKYGQYTLPGGENYRELLLTLPSKGVQFDPSQLTIKRNLSSVTQGTTTLKYGDVNLGTWGDNPQLKPGGKYEQKPDLHWIEVAQKLFNEGDRINKIKPLSGNYESSHWKETNVLAHVRFDERTGPDGEKILHVAEIQSDWGQEGRKKGFGKSEVTVKPLTKQDLAEEEQFHYAANFKNAPVVYGAFDRSGRRLWIGTNESEVRRIGEKAAPKAVPEMPFPKSWHEFAFKRALRYAVENGYDKLTWDTGETNAERYDLSKHIDRIEYEAVYDDNEKPTGEYEVLAIGKNGDRVLHEDEVPLSRIEELVGKEIAQKIQNDEGKKKPDTPYRNWKVLSGLDLKVGGEGMRGFYDKILPDFANKYVKKWGAKVEKSELTRRGDILTQEYSGPDRSEADVKQYIAMGRKHGSVTLVAQAEDVLDAMKAGDSFKDAVQQKGSISLARDFGGDIKQVYPQITHPVHSVTITPQMRESVMAGQPLFARDSKSVLGDSEPKASFRNGILWVNASGFKALGKALGLNENASGVHIPRAQAGMLLVRPSLKNMRSAIAEAVSEGPVTVVRHDAGQSISKSKELARHEMFHRTEKFARDGRGDLLLADPLAQKAATHLESLGYNAADTDLLFSEIGAHLVSGQNGWDKMGLTYDEARQLANKYFSMLPMETVKKLRNITPHLREELNAARRLVAEIEGDYAQLDAGGDGTGDQAGSGGAQRDLQPDMGEDVSEEPREALTKEDVKASTESARDFASIVRDQFILPARSVLERQGPEGKRLARLIERAFDVGEVQAGQRLEQLLDAELNKLSKPERAELLDVLEGRSDETSEKVWAAHDIVRAILDEMGQAAEDLGVEVTYTRTVWPGEPIDGLDLKPGQVKALESGRPIRIKGKRAFKPRQDYFPHIIPNVEVLQRGVTPHPIREDIIQNMVRLGLQPNEEEAANFIDKYVEFIKDGGRQKELEQYLIDSGQASSPEEALLIMRKFRQRTIKRVGQLEHARDVDFPLYDPDPARVLPGAITRASLRQAQIQMLGQYNQRVNKLVKKIEDAGGDPELTMKVVDAILGMANQGNTKESKLSRMVRGYQASKLGLSAIPNSVQGFLNSLLRADLESALKGTKAAFTQEGKRLAVRSGATLEATLEETLRHAGGDSSGLISWFLRKTGFTATERMNRTIAANAGAMYANKLLQRLKANPKDTRARDLLKEFGINPDRVVENGKLTPGDVLLAAKKFSDVTQFRSRPQDVPLFASTPAGKVFFQFKNYIYGQTRLLNDEILGEIKAGRPGRAMRSLLILAILFPMAGGLIKYLRDLVTGRKPKKEDELKKYLDAAGQVGAGGMLLDIVQEGSYDSGFGKWILGPTVSEWGIENPDLIRKALQGKMSQGDKRRVTRKIPLFGPIMADRLYPDKKK